MKTKYWIAHAIQNPGSLHKALKIPEGEVIPLKVLQNAAKGNTLTARRARLALTLRKFH